MLQVFITVDTEVWPHAPNWRQDQLSRDFMRDIMGNTRKGIYGLPYQIEVLNRYNLSAVFLVEALFADAVGTDHLQHIVRLVQEGGHEVQLHLHPEWLAFTESPVLPNRTGQNMKDFSEEEQTVLIARGIENLKSCGVKNICAFRAGNYGADFNTLRALAKNGVRYDTSHNMCYLSSNCGLSTPELTTAPRCIEGVYEFPIAYFQDWPGHLRHAQICACSGKEMQSALLKAWKNGWHSFVIVSHSFELLKNRKRFTSEFMPDRTVVARFESLCRFLAANPDKFQTATFGEADPAAFPATSRPYPLTTGVHLTAQRYMEQLGRRTPW